MDTNIESPETKESSHLSGVHKDEIDALPNSLRFNYFDIGCIFVSMTTYIFDLGMDVFIACIYYSNDALNYFIVTLLFVLIPAITMTAFSFRWYIMDLENEDCPKPSYTKWTVRICFLILQLAPVLRYIDSLIYGLKSRIAKAKGDKVQQLKCYTNMVNEDTDATLLRLFEAFMEAAPQVTLQVYIFAVHYNDKEGGPFGGRNYKIQVLAICTSLVSLAWSLSSYNRSLRFSQQDKPNISYAGTILQFLWHFCGISARVFAIGMFASCYPLLMLPICAAHWLVMMSWLIIQEKETWTCEKVLLNWIVAFIYIFTFFNVHDEPTRYKYFTYYLICFIENIILISVWFLNFCVSNLVYHSWIRTTVLVGHFVLFFLGLSFMSLYYGYFHPSLSRKISVSGDRRESHIRAEFLTRRASVDVHHHPATATTPFHLEQTTETSELSA